MGPVLSVVLINVMIGFIRHFFFKFVLQMHAPFLHRSVSVRKLFISQNRFKNNHSKYAREGRNSDMERERWRRAPGGEEGEGVLHQAEID